MTLGEGCPPAPVCTHACVCAGNGSLADRCVGLSGRGAKGRSLVHGDARHAALVATGCGCGFTALLCCFVFLSFLIRSGLLALLYIPCPSASLQ